MKTASGLLTATGLLLLSALLFNCATVPPPGEGGYPSLLYRRGDLLLILNIEAHPELAETVITRFVDPQVADAFLERTERLYARLYEDFAGTAPENAGEEGAEDSRRLGFEIIAEGRYPRRFAGFALAREGWEKRREPRTWWDFPNERIQIALPGSGIAALSQEKMPGLLRRILEPGGASKLPEEVSIRSKEAALLLYGREPRFDRYVDRRISILLSKLEEFTMVFDEEGERVNGEHGDYLIDANYRFTDERTARSFLLSSRLALLSRARREGKEAVMRLVEKRNVRQEGRNVRISGARIDLEDIHLLFGIFTPLF